MAAARPDRTIRLLLAVHCHQPVGNFEWVIAQAYDRAYAPFLDVLERHPHIRCALHYTGPLWDWFSAHRKPFLPRVAALVTRGQVELLGGGYYEPILPMIPEPDRQGQLAQLGGAIERLTGRRPRGAWLAERVWEPDLPRTFAQAGIDYTIVDDTHFRAATPWLPPEAVAAHGASREILGYYTTEHLGARVAIFPASKSLRYSMPFKQPHETIDLLRRVARGGAYSIAFADDGEKFGFWPKTYDWVYKERWLERFCEALERERDWIQLSTFSEMLDAHPPRGRVYLPHASYDEMLEWSGGNFRNFLVKYPEANLMHKRMLDVSRRLQDAAAGRKRAGSRRADPLAAAQRHLYMAQCNCAYWHGVFGGLYLGHLRSAVFEHLIAAERALGQATHRTARWTDRRIVDLDADGDDEVVVQTPALGLIIDPAEGASVVSLDDVARGTNLVNTLTRRREAYHDKLKHKHLQVVTAGAAASHDSPASIHDIVGVKERGLEEHLVYDNHRRAAFVDHCFDRAVTVQDLMGQPIEEAGEVLGARYTLPRAAAGGKTPSILCERLTPIRDVQGRQVLVRVQKRFDVRADRPALTVSYRLSAKNRTGSIFRGTEEQPACWWGVELNLFLKDASLNQPGTVPSLSVVEINDAWRSVKVRLRYAQPATLVHYPLETISESEEGMERTYQGLCVCAVWPITFDARGVWHTAIDLTLEPLPCPA